MLIFLVNQLGINGSGHVRVQERPVCSDVCSLLPQRSIEYLFRITGSVRTARRDLSTVLAILIWVTCKGSLPAETKFWPR